MQRTNLTASSGRPVSFVHVNRDVPQQKSKETASTFISVENPKINSLEYCSLA
jgi:hypothetical protein